MPFTIISLGAPTPTRYNRTVHELLYKFDSHALNERGEFIKMPIKIVAQNAIPPRKKAISAKVVPEINEILAALPTLKQGAAIHFTLSPETSAMFAGKTKKGKVKLPGRIVVAKLNRRFVDEGLSFKSYTNDDTNLFVIRETPAPSTNNKKK